MSYHAINTLHAAMPLWKTFHGKEQTYKLSSLVMPNYLRATSPYIEVILWMISCYAKQHMKANWIQCIYIPWRYLELCTFSYINIMFLSYHYVSNPKCHCKIIYFQLAIKKTYQSYTKRNKANVRNQKRNSFPKV